MTASMAAEVGASLVGPCGACVRCGHEGGNCTIRKTSGWFYMNKFTFVAVRSPSGNLLPASVVTDDRCNRQSL